MPAGVWVDGELVEKLAARVSLFDHAVLFGDGVTTGTRLVNRQVFRFAEHRTHLELCARALDLRLPSGRAAVEQAVQSAVLASERQNGYVKILLTRGAGTLGPDPRKCEPGLIVIVDDLLPFPPELRGVGLALATARQVTRRPGHLADLGFTLANFVATTACREALAAGCFEALVLTDAGQVSGTTSSALFAMQGHTLLTGAAAVSPDPVMRACVLDWANRVGLTVRESLDADELRAADEVFFAGCGVGVHGVSSLDGQPLRRGPWTAQVREAIGF